MKSIILVALALVAVAVALPVEETAKIVESNFDKTPEGNYKFGFKSDDGTQREEEGQVTEVRDEENNPHNVVVVRGSYTYTNSEGTDETVTYVADQNGFRAEGPSIPKAARR